MQKRYTDTTKLITDTEKSELANTGEVMIYSGGKWYNKATINLRSKEKFEDPAWR